MIVNLKNPHSNFFERTSTLVRYYDDIKKYKLLSIEEEKKLFSLIKNGTDKEKEYARNTIINSNQRFVIAIVKRFATNDNFLDLIDEANFGLIQAMEKFDSSYENGFVTFAVHYIRRAINSYCINYGSIIKKSNIPKTYHVISQATNKFVQKEFRQPTKEELFDILNNEYKLNIKDVKDILDTSISYIDESVSDDDDFSVSERTFNEYSSSKNQVENKLSDEFNKTIVQSLLLKLNKNEQKVIKMSFGIGFEREYEIQEISKEMGLTSERVRQLKKESVVKLKKFYVNLLNKI